MDSGRSAGHYSTKTAVELFEVVSADWGEVCERRLWRCLKWLVDNGLLQRVGERGTEDYGYRLVRQAEQRMVA